MSWPFLHELIVHDEVESTNDLARAVLAGDPPAAPFAIQAFRQTRGRGRGGNRWWSDRGSLLITLVLDPHAHRLTVAHEARLALVGALSLVEVIAGLRPVGRLGLKWPNDVQIGRRKVAGFLTERVEVARGRFVILGMGVNVLTSLDDAPLEVRALATSLKDVTEAPGVLSLDSILHAFLGNFERHLSELAEDRPSLASLWNAYDLLLDRPVRVEQGDRWVEGVGAGIDPLGGLILLNDQERVVVYGGTVVKIS